MKILYGLERPTSGQIFLRGQPVQIANPQAAIRLGIGMVHQNFMLIPSFTIAENVVLNMEPTRGIAVDRVKALAQTRALAEQYGLNVTPEAQVEAVPAGMCERGESLKALHGWAAILILDDPNAGMTPGGRIDLFKAITHHAQQCEARVYISH